MFEIRLAVYFNGVNSRINFDTPHNEKIRQKECGVAGVLGNKGGVQCYFTLGGFSFSIIGVHLVHGVNNRDKRDEMMSKLIKSFKYEGTKLDPDSFFDFNIILGDLNYRFESTYSDMMSSQIYLAPNLLGEKDEFTRT